ncbi:Gfo/Idh/MocA family protein [Spirosoma oryzicola]|uniref:Gfo/Idh/MocA family protein n=1 Tax=Spirosoma oryzicola TaxID=2898794 RepID=UPI001E2D4BF5|nr:Gfo/Idh/MocA family oxidoreductase [Spirosoma oryzicola]UHG94458.1 Gfo/Idh/MocA family oxidoreductase [Spirosoma oryzicola]
MLKIGIIGLGDIATKAYLPLLAARADIEIHLCSTTTEKMQRIAGQYRISHVHPDISSLIMAGIQAVFVHAATVAHHAIVETLLEARVAVFVDKPLTLHFAQSEQLVKLAKQTNTLLMIGFNRRYAPIYRQLKAVDKPTMILMQKNRPVLPGEIRSFVLDDFIHVVDTLRWLFPFPIADWQITYMREDDQLKQLTLQLKAPHGETALGIMNRNTAITEERLEIMSASQKLVAVNISQLIRESTLGSDYVRQNDWEPTLHKRGFALMVDDFLRAVAGECSPYIDLDDALMSHQLCEQIIERVMKESY